MIVFLCVITVDFSVQVQIAESSSCFFAAAYRVIHKHGSLLWIKQPIKGKLQCRIVSSSVTRNVYDYILYAVFVSILMFKGIECLVENTDCVIWKRNGRRVRICLRRACIICTPGVIVSGKLVKADDGRFIIVNDLK